jgi:hypothetical protein
MLCLCISTNQSPSPNAPILLSSSGGILWLALSLGDSHRIFPFLPFLFSHTHTHFVNSDSLEFAKQMGNKRCFRFLSVFAETALISCLINSRKTNRGEALFEGGKRESITCLARVLQVLDWASANGRPAMVYFAKSRVMLLARSTDPKTLRIHGAIPPFFLRVAILAILRLPLRGQGNGWYIGCTLFSYPFSQA